MKKVKFEVWFFGSFIVLVIFILAYYISLYEVSRTINKNDIFVGKIHYIEINGKVINYTEDSLNYENSLPPPETISFNTDSSEVELIPRTTDNCGDQTQSH